MRVCIYIYVYVYTYAYLHISINSTAAIGKKGVRVMHLAQRLRAKASILRAHNIYMYVYIYTYV